jgi:hypothetical protein
MEWISLKDRMPTLGDWVLGLTHGRGIYEIRRVASINPNGYSRLDWGLPYYVKEDAIFTHWMPLPQPPVEE